MYVDRTEIADRMAALALATVHMAAVAERSTAPPGLLPVGCKSVVSWPKASASLIRPPGYCATGREAKRTTTRATTSRRDPGDNAGPAIVAGLFC
jgi:hypothetical protein